MIKKGDFIELNYTGKIKDSSIVFDTSLEEVAKENGMYDESISYGPVVICIGQKQLVKGLDEHLPGKEEDKPYRIELKPEDAFGKKEPKLLKIVNTSVLLKQNIRPMPGLQLNIDGTVGTVRTVTGGRTVVDFNHPLAGKEIVYEIKINKVVKEPDEKIKGFIALELKQKADVSVNEGIAEVRMEKEIPQPVKDELQKKIIEIVKVKEVRFVRESKKALESGAGIDVKDVSVEMPGQPEPAKQ